MCDGGSGFYELIQYHVIIALIPGNWCSIHVHCKRTTRCCVEPYRQWNRVSKSTHSVVKLTWVEILDRVQILDLPFL